MRIRLFTAPLALLVLASCRNAADYRREADETAKVYLSAYQQEAVGRVEKIEIETPADTLRRRLMIDQTLLAKDPASFGIRDIPTNLYWRVGDRMLPGGDLYSREERFFDLVESRTEEPIHSWLAGLSIPVISVDGRRSPQENVRELIDRLPHE